MENYPNMLNTNKVKKNINIKHSTFFKKGDLAIIFNFLDKMKRNSPNILCKLYQEIEILNENQEVQLNKSVPLEYINNSYNPVVLKSNKQSIQQSLNDNPTSNINNVTSAITTIMNSEIQNKPKVNNISTDSKQTTEKSKQKVLYETVTDLDNQLTLTNSFEYSSKKQLSHGNKKNPTSEYFLNAVTTNDTVGTITRYQHKTTLSFHENTPAFSSENLLTQGINPTSEYFLDTVTTTDASSTRSYRHRTKQSFYENTSEITTTSDKKVDYDTSKKIANKHLHKAQKHKGHDSNENTKTNTLNHSKTLKSLKTINYKKGNKNKALLKQKHNKTIKEFNTKLKHGKKISELKMKHIKHFQRHKNNFRPNFKDSESDGREIPWNKIIGTNRDLSTKNRDRLTNYIIKD